MDREEFFDTALAGALAQNGWAVTASDIDINGQDVVHVSIVNYGFHNNSEATVEASFLIDDNQEEQVRDLMESALDNLWDDAGSDQYTKDLIRRGSAQVSTETDPDGIFSVYIYADSDFIRNENMREIMRLTDFARESIGILCNNVLVPYAAHELNASYQNRAITIGTIDPKGNLNDGIVVHAVDNRNVIASVIRNDARMPYEHHPLSEGEGDNRTFTIDGSTYSLADIKPVEKAAEQDGPSEEVHDEVLRRVQDSLRGRTEFIKVCNYLNDHDIPFELSEQAGTEKLTVYAGDAEGHVWFNVFHNIGSEELTVDENLIFDPAIDVLEHGLNGQDVIDRIDTLNCTVGICKVSDDLSLTIHQFELSNGKDPGWVLVSGTIGDADKMSPKIYTVQYDKKNEPGIIWHGQAAKLKDATWLDSPDMDQGPVWGSEKFLESFRAAVEEERRNREVSDGPDRDENDKYENNPDYNPYKDSITERMSKMPEENQVNKWPRIHVPMKNATEFTSKDGTQYWRIKVPEQNAPWGTMVMRKFRKNNPEKENLYVDKSGKTYSFSVPVDGTTKVSYPVTEGQDENGKFIYSKDENQKTIYETKEVPNKDLVEKMKLTSQRDQNQWIGVFTWNRDERTSKDGEPLWRIPVPNPQQNQPYGSIIISQMTKADPENGRESKERMHPCKNGGYMFNIPPEGTTKVSYPVADGKDENDQYIFSKDNDGNQIYNVVEMSNKDFKDLMNPPQERQQSQEDVVVNMEDKPKDKNFDLKGRVQDLTDKSHIMSDKPKAQDYNIKKDTDIVK